MMHGAAEAHATLTCALSSVNAGTAQLQFARAATFASQARTLRLGANGSTSNEPD